MLKNTKDIDIDITSRIILEQSINNVLNGLLTLLTLQECGCAAVDAEKEIIVRFLCLTQNKPNALELNEQTVKVFPSVLRALASRIEIQSYSLKIENSTLVN
ncbi:MAG: hypothetical protein FD167_2562 [bacterium]|nr:MAG: hypothetical protein FD167_2562 [bacterium]